MLVARNCPAIAQSLRFLSADQRQGGKAPLAMKYVTLLLEWNCSELTETRKAAML